MAAIEIANRIHASFIIRVSGIGTVIQVEGEGIVAGSETVVGGGVFTVELEEALTAQTLFPGVNSMIMITQGIAPVPVMLIAELQDLAVAGVFDTILIRVFNAAGAPLATVDTQMSVLVFRFPNLD